MLLLLVSLALHFIFLRNFNAPIENLCGLINKKKKIDDPVNSDEILKKDTSRELSKIISSPEGWEDFPDVQLLDEVCDELHAVIFSNITFLIQN